MCSSDLVAGQCAFAVLLFRQFFVTLPPGLIEAARIDGANWMRVLWSIGLPLARPALATYCSITFLTAWNMYIWPLLVALVPPGIPRLYRCIQPNA